MSHTDHEQALQNLTDRMRAGTPEQARWLV
jgi:hypothetical protein